MKVMWSSSSDRRDKKLKELVLYIAQKSEDDPSFGATKLNKILFAADFYFFGQTGRSITGASYVHRGKGRAVVCKVNVEKAQSLARCLLF